MQKTILSFFLYGLAVIILGLVFLAYFAPETMIAVTNQVWAFCGW